MVDVRLAPASDRLKRASERRWTRGVGLALTGGRDEEPVAEHVAQRRQQRRSRGFWTAEMRRQQNALAREAGRSLTQDRAASKKRTTSKRRKKASR